MLRGLLDLVGHPLAEIAVFGLGLVFLHKRDARPAVRNAVAVENSQVHEIIAKDMGDDRGERLSAVKVRKAVVAGKAGRREPDDAADSRKNFGHGEKSLGMLRPRAVQEMICAMSTAWERGVASAVHSVPDACITDVGDSYASIFARRRHRQGPVAAPIMRFATIRREWP